MNKSITILDKDYAQWVKELRRRYRHSQMDTRQDEFVPQLGGLILNDLFAYSI